MCRMALRQATVYSLLSSFALALPAPSPAQGRRPVKRPTDAAPASGADSLNNLRFRNLGPSVAGGRVSAVVGVTGDRNLYYVGAAAGGVWKTTDGGDSWEAVFKDQPTASIGAIALAPSNPNVVWVGTGEENPRNDVVDGRGVFMSPDAGKSWQFMGLGDVGQVSRIVIDPANPDVGSESRARRVPQCGRRQDVAEGVVRQRYDRRHGPGDGTGQPPHVVRRDVAVRAPSLGARVRRDGERRLSLQGRRPDMGITQGRAAVGTDGEHRRRRGPHQPEPHLFPHRDEGGDAVGFKGPGRPLEQGLRLPRAVSPAVLLLPAARFAGGRPEGVFLVVLAASLRRRRQDDDADRPRRARGPSRVVD